MKARKLSVVSTSKDSVVISWSPYQTQPPLSTRTSSTSLFQKNRGVSRACLTLEERKESRSSIISETSTGRSSAGRQLSCLAKDSIDEYQSIIESEPLTKKWFTLQIKDRLFGWTTVYWGYRDEAEVASLAPGEVYQFRLRTTADEEESGWSETLYAATKDDIVSAASLHRALDNGNVPSSRKIIALRSSAIEVPNKMGRTPLAIASHRGDVSLCSMLLACGADINSEEGGSYKTPLMIAAFKGNTELMGFFKERDADWNARDRFGQTILHYCVMNAQVSQLGVLKIALKEFSNANVKDSKGWTPLMLAVTVQTTKYIIDCLLSHGADINLTDKRGQTVLMQSVLTGAPQTIRHILNKGADIAAENIYGHTAYDMALNSNVKAIQDLLPDLLPIPKVTETNPSTPKIQKEGIDEEITATGASS